MSEANERVKRIVVGITGASGAVYARGVLRGLLAAGVEVHLVVTKCGRRLLSDELGVDLGDGVAGLIGVSGVGDGGDGDGHGRGVGEVIVHPVNDIGASIASGTFEHGGMVVVPCSSNSLGMIANGIGNNLLTRAAAVCLKEGRRLVLAHRESPLNLIDIENMRRLALAGAVIAPANPGWYLRPVCLDDIANFVSGRLLDALGVEHDLVGRWGEGAGDG